MELEPAPPKEALPTKHVVALQARLARIHEARLLANEKLFRLEDMVADAAAARAVALGFYSIATSQYCRVERNKTRDVAPSRSRRDHRKSKFGLRHAIKLN
jgi:hypothetical protein